MTKFSEFNFLPESQLILLRGIPGAGKTTLAQKLAQKFSIPNFEADHWYMLQGEYCYDPQYIGYAHKWCEANTLRNMRMGKSVIVSNTSLVASRSMNYVLFCLKHNFSMHIIHCQGGFQSVHDVPAFKMDRMKKDETDLKSYISTIKYLSNEAHSTRPNIAGYTYNGRTDDDSIEGNSF